MISAIASPPVQSYSFVLEYSIVIVMILHNYVTEMVAEMFGVYLSWGSANGDKDKMFSM